MRMTMLLHPVDRLAEAIDFYRDCCGWREKFRDGERFALLETGSVPVGFVSGEERIVERPAAVFEVPDVDQAAAAFMRAGARVLRAAEDGPHERRAVLADPGGQPFVLSCRLPVA